MRILLKLCFVVTVLLVPTMLHTDETVLHADEPGILGYTKSNPSTMNRLKMLSERSNVMARPQDFGYPGEAVVGETLPPNPNFILFDRMEKKSISELASDLKVMNLLLTKAILGDMSASVTRHSPSQTVLHDVKLPGLQGMVLRPQYVQGFGAIFEYNVSFPVTSGTSKTAKPDPEPKKITLWETARQELFGGAKKPKPSPRLAYDPKRVEMIQANLTAALHEAGNLRHLGDEEKIVVIVNGAKVPVGEDQGVSVLAARVSMEKPDKVEFNTHEVIITGSGVIHGSHTLPADLVQPPILEALPPHTSTPNTSKTHRYVPQRPEYVPQRPVTTPVPPHTSIPKSSR